MTDKYSGFCAWSASFLQKWTTIHRSSWQKMHKKGDNWDEAGTKIAASVHRAHDSIS
jgi:hypothetical protein